MNGKCIEEVCTPQQMAQLMIVAESNISLDGDGGDQFKNEKSYQGMARWSFRRMWGKKWFSDLAGSLDYYRLRYTQSAPFDSKNEIGLSQAIVELSLGVLI